MSALPARPQSPLRRVLLTASVTALLASGLTGPAASPSSATAPTSAASTTVAARAVVQSAAQSAGKKKATNPATPGDFTGYGFDQCLAPTQSAMDAWLESSPYLAVGIYISGDSRACRNQPNLTPTWIRTQLAQGWRLLPITLGPQASCQPRFPRYKDDFKISPQRGAGKYSKARTMGKNSGTSTVADAEALGIVAGSTLWYDLEGFDLGNTDCRESALAFVHAWTKTVKDAGYVAGLYSSASSGIKMVDDARVDRPNAFVLPDRIWLARWDGAANTSSSYIRDDGWRPRDRVKQYRGGHDETWGGVRINIDNNYLDLGKGSVAPVETHCGGVVISFKDYPPLAPASADYTPPAPLVKALQCLLTEKGLYSGKITGVYNRTTIKAANGWQTKRGNSADARFFKRDWMSLLAYGRRPVLKIGSAGAYVRRVQRALNAAAVSDPIKAGGVYDSATAAAVRYYQQALKLPVSGIVDNKTFTALRQGLRR